MPWMADLTGLRTAARALDEAGFDHLTTSGHLLTAEDGRYPQVPSFTYALPFRDPFVLMAYLAAVTERIAFRTSILILPMLPTALVAKQAADLSLLSGGRFELGVGISWQRAEYEALGQSMSDRGAKLAEQITVVRMLWTQELVTYHGRFHTIDGLGLGQLPSAPIPIWIGCSPTTPLLERVARLGDGWIPGGGVTTAEPARQLRELAQAAGRTVGVAGRVVVRADSAEAVAEAVAEAQRQLDAGATELTLVADPAASVSEALPGLIAARRGGVRPLAENADWANTRAPGALTGGRCRRRPPGSTDR
ncbi:MAG: monooxygenase [Frankiales bacterium]|nr:monooxygenase [Frankiales bacterium]